MILLSGVKQEKRLETACRWEGISEMRGGHDRRTTPDGPASCHLSRDVRSRKPGAKQAVSEEEDGNWEAATGKETHHKKQTT